MMSPLIGFFLAAVIPVFFGKLRSAPLWLCLQAIMLGWNSIAREAGISQHALFALAEIALIRVCLVPFLLNRTIARRAEPNLDLMPSNLFAWLIATTLIVLAFKFGGSSIATPATMTLGVVGATVMMALLILSTNVAPVAQLVALLYMENALALFESLLPEPWPLPVHIVLAAIYVLTVGLASWLLATEASPDSTGGKKMSEEVL